MRQVFDASTDEHLMRRVVATLECRGLPLAEETDPGDLTGINEHNVRDGILTLEEVRECERLRRVIFERALLCVGPTEKAMKEDFTLFKTASRGHRKAPHLDVYGYPHRVLTGILYLSDCESGAILFGTYDASGGFIEHERLLPRRGRLVVFDDDQTNVHCVDEFNGDVRHNVTTWFQWASSNDRRDWVVEYLTARGGEALALASTLRGNRRELYDRLADVAAQGRANAEWSECTARLMRVLETEFTVDQFVEACPSQNSGVEFLSALVEASIVAPAIGGSKMNGNPQSQLQQNS
jgi:hypothetical protein